MLSIGGRASVATRSHAHGQVSRAFVSIPLQAQRVKKEPIASMRCRGRVVSPRRQGLSANGPEGGGVRGVT